MKNNDVELIQRVLDGDDTAFSDLVKKYHKSVHALAWRKIEDFHIAEEITQDTFLKAYQRLSTLKKPQSFASWLYVIAANRCKAWYRKKRLCTQSLETTSSTELEEMAYSNYVIEENERNLSEAKREVVKKLLAKLQESDRTVITLYYLGGMTYEEISRFLGVSVSAIKNRLYRARQHLKKEEPMIREALEHFQITPNLTDNIMREIARLKPTAPTGGKPLVPWTLAAASALLIVLLLGLGSQQLVHFQKPYSLDAQADTTVELVDTPVVLNLEAKTDVSRQLGNTNVLGDNESNGQKPDEVSLASAQVNGKDVSVPKQQWIPAEHIKGSPLESILGTSDGDIYVLGNEWSLYKLPSDSQEWQHISDLFSIDTEWVPSALMAKWKDTLYIVPSNKLFSSSDDGRTWKLVYSFQEEFGPRGLILGDDVFYIAFSTGIFRSKDSGKTWHALKSEAMENIHFLERIQNTVFAVTDNGLFRFSNDNWKHIKLPEPTIGSIFSVATTEDKLYFAAEFSWEMINPEKVFQGQERGWWVFRSNDFGESWKDITPTNAWSQKEMPPSIALIAFDETLLALDREMVRSIDAGDTWLPPFVPRTSSSMISHCRAAVVNDLAFFISSEDGLHRSTDGGRSWDKVNIPQVKEMSPIDTLILYDGNDNKQNMHPTLYARFGGEYLRMKGEIAKTTDKGKSWNSIGLDIPMKERSKEGHPNITQIVKSGDNVYTKDGMHGKLKTLLYRLSEDGNKLVPIQDIPLFDEGLLRNYYMYTINRPHTDEHKKHVEENSFGAAQFFKQLTELGSLQNDHLVRIRKRELFDLGFQGPFAVNNDIIYMEYNFKLFKCKRGDTLWSETGVEETVELTLDIARIKLKLAVSGNTVYVGKRDGHLVVSFDSGNKWTDLTPAIPFTVKEFKDIVITGSTVYVATDAGIITSDGGKQWDTITEKDGTNLIMEHLAVDGTTLYGVTQKTGIFRLENGTWEQVVPEIPDKVTSLAIDGKTVYVGTEYNEVFHFNLED